jgi:hypothetical protein
VPAPIEFLLFFPDNPKLNIMETVFITLLLLDLLIALHVVTRAKEIDADHDDF